MTEIQEYIDGLAKQSEDRLNQFKIVELNSIKDIEDEAYLEKPTWLGGDKQFVCLFIDLDDSSKHSFKKQSQTMAKIYDYFTQNIVDILNHPIFGADYIDIKGDGAFGIFEGDKASYKALYCAITFKTLFEQIISKKFSTDSDMLSCKFGIHKDKILVRKIGKRGARNYNEVWAGRLVNNAAKLSNQSKKVPPNPMSPFSLPILVSEQVYVDFEKDKKYGFYYCCIDGQNANNNPVKMFLEFNHFSDDVLGNKFYYTNVVWCKNCADNYISLI